MQKAKMAISSSLTARSIKASNRFKSYSLNNDDSWRAHPLVTTVYGGGFLWPLSHAAEKNTPLENTGRKVVAPGASSGFTKKNTSYIIYII